jgi:hypothetical protein
VTILVTTVAFLHGWIDGFPFMVAIGVGMYVPYVAYHTTLFERMIAVFRDGANLGYLMYLADAFGYLGYVAVLLLHNVVSLDETFLALLTSCCVVVSVVSLLAVGWTSWHYRRRMGRTIDTTNGIAAHAGD